MKIPFSPPDITDAEVEQVAEALRSGWITTGPKTKELEREVADFCGVNRAVCLNSQTACAEMTLRVLGVGEGDEVITCACVRNGSASVSVSANSFWDLLKCQQLIEKSWNKEYQEALQFIGIKNVLYSAVVIGIKAKVNTKVIKDTVRKFEREHNKWYLNSYIKTWDFRHRFFLKTIKYRCLGLTKAYVFLHSLLMK